MYVYPFRRRLLLLLALTVFLLTAVLPVSAQEAFTIQNFVVQVQVDDDTRIHIEETITLTFSEPRRGIIRDIPLTFRGMPVNLENLRVVGDPYERSTENNYAMVRIGDPNVYLDPGVPKTYRIRYTMNFGASFIEENNELFYLNLIGPEWDTTIAGGEFIITMPKEFDGTPSFTAGPVGSEDGSKIAFNPNDLEQRTFRATLREGLSSREAVTVFLELPKGYYSGYRPPGQYLHILVPLLAALVAAFSYMVWHTRGKDSHLVITPEFYPPEEITPTEAGFIYDGAASSQDVTSLILYLAGKGHLIIEEMGKNELRLIKRAPLTEKEKPFVSYFFDKLFKGRQDEVTTKELAGTFYQEMNTTSRLVADHFQDPQTRLLERSSVISSVLMTMLSFVPIWALGMAVHLVGLKPFFGPETVFLGLMLAMFPFAGMAGLVTFIVRNKVMPRATSLGLLLVSVPALVGGTALMVALSVGTALALVVIPVLVLVLSAHFLARLTTKRTPYGDRIMGKVLGFRRFLLTAEKNRIETLLEENPAYFYDILPYAIVLRVTAKWAEKFKDLAIQPPEWYRGYAGTRFNTLMFANTMNRSLIHASTRMATNPQSGSGGRGFGGGGFSGGGGGGGGGRSW
jgi:uncharacterized membrane protein YgcG